MSNFITNQHQQKTVAGRLRALLEHAEELKFLVGFFYFSGWAELYASLREREQVRVKLLVGLEVDELLGRTVEHANIRGDRTGEESIDEFFDSLATALNSEQMDTEAFHEQVGFFLEMIEAGRLEIRKTRDPNHAKLYLFKASAALGGWNAARFITGSSNLTRAGLHGQHEFNVEIGDYGTDEAEAYFDGLWDTALPITADDGRRRRLIDFVRHHSQAADVTPFEAYTLMLKTYVELQELKQIKPQVVRLMEERDYRPYSYQLDAVSQALTILDTYNGVIVADVVGLGKSVIASLIGRSLGRRGLIICPPGLMGDADGNAGGWNMYRHHFKLYDWEVRSLGKLAETLDYVRSLNGEDIEVVIVDEAHRFRNQDTEAYELLSHICRGKKVILLTATPFNNSPADIFSMLKLFIVPGQSGITLDADLETRFAFYESQFRDLAFITRHHASSDSAKRLKAESLYTQLIEDAQPVDLAKVKAESHDLAEEIRAVLEPVLIRRNRIDLKNDHQYCREVTDIPEAQDPEELFFELDHGQAAFYENVIGRFFGSGGEFKGAIYQPFNYEQRSTGNDVEDGFRKTSQRNLYDFMRRLLVKRFESSFGAFYDSIGRFLTLHDVVLKFIERTGRYILDRGLIEKIYLDDEEVVEEALDQFAADLAADDEHGDREKVYVIAEFQEGEAFLADIRADRDLFRRIKEMLDTFGLVEDDPKRDRLIQELGRLRTEEPERKLVIFTEYTDTVAHLRGALEEAFPGQVLAVGGGQISRGLYDRIYTNFDASASALKQADKFHVLVTSDKLSEGYNLNRAGTVINYDIPWNPTRVIQRVGRINRIGKTVFRKLYLYNFFPTEQGADVVHSREIAQQKMFLIHSILGEDAKMFDVDEEPSAAELYKRINRNPEQTEEESLLTSVRNRLAEIAEQHPEVLERIRRLPSRVKTGKAAGQDGVIVLQRKGLGLFVQVVKEPKAEKPTVEELTFGAMLPLVECPPEEPRMKLSDRFWPAYEAVKAFQPRHRRTHSENAIETKAMGALNAAVRRHSEVLESLQHFARQLIRDMREFHTLPKHTLRMLSRHDLTGGSAAEKLDALKEELEKLRRLLGEDYLLPAIEEAKRYRSEIIIAVENQAD